MVAPELSAPLAGLAARRRIGARTRGYLASDLDGAWLVLACTGQAAVNAAIEAGCRAAPDLVHPGRRCRGPGPGAGPPGPSAGAWRGAWPGA